MLSQAKNQTWSIKGADKPKVDNIDLQRERKESFEQDEKLKKLLNKDLKIQESFADEFFEDIDQGYFKNHLKEQMDKCVATLK